MISIIPVKDKKTLLQFIKLPWAIYQANQYWVPPLISEEKKLFDRAHHPFYKHAEVELFIARDEPGHPLGRIAAIVNHNHIKYHNELVGFFGFFETVNSPEVASRLLESARDYLRTHLSVPTDVGAQAGKIARMRGPASFSSNEQWGCLVAGFDSAPYIMMPYHPAYYEPLLTGYGLVKVKDLYAYYVDRPTVFADGQVRLPDKFFRIAERIKSRQEIVVRNLDMKRFEDEIKMGREIYNRAWQDNWGAIPMTEEEMNYLAANLKRIIVPELVFIAEVAGQPAGFSLALPDYNQVLKKLNGKLSPLGLVKALWYARQVKTLRLITMGVIKEYQKRGIDVVFYIETIKQGIARGYEAAELSWVLEDNDLMNRTLQSFGARLYKKYRIYEMPL